jgi:hypothetical protein
MMPNDHAIYNCSTRAEHHRVQDGDAAEAYPFEELRPEHDAPSYVMTRDRWLLKPPRLD